MQKIIERAVAGGFDVSQGSIGVTLGKQELGDDGCFTYPKNIEGELYMMNIYHLLFNNELGFIEALVKSKCYLGCTFDDIYGCATFRNETVNEKPTYSKWCVPYIRAKLATIPTLEGKISYLEGLL
jgi:hypothetical protein